MKTSEIVVVASKFRVAAFRKSNGQPLWETVLITSFFTLGASFVTLALDEGAIYAHATNLLFCLDPSTGRILWQQEARSLGRDVVSIAVLGGGGTGASALLAKIQADRQRDGGGD